MKKYLCTLLLLVFIAIVVTAETPSAARRLKCQANLGSVHTYRIVSYIEILNASHDEGIIRGRNNATHIKSTVNLGCDDGMCICVLVYSFCYILFL